VVNAHHLEPALAETKITTKTQLRRKERYLRIENIKSVIDGATFYRFHSPQTTLM
jgi:hypothetical protein